MILCLLGAHQAEGVLAVGEHDFDARVQYTAFDRIDDSLQIGAAARYQHDQMLHNARSYLLFSTRYLSLAILTNRSQ